MVIYSDSATTCREIQFQAAYKCLGLAPALSTECYRWLCRSVGGNLPTSSSACDEGVSVCRPTFGIFGGATPVVICVARAHDAGEEGIHGVGPTRFWPSHLGDPPEPRLIISPREPAGRSIMEVPVDAKILAAGDHHGSTFYQHQGFQRAVLGEQEPEVTVSDGWRAVRMGMAAQQSSKQNKVIKLS